MAIINPRDASQDCWMPSVRQSFATVIEALADTPRTGDIYEIGGDLFYWDGIQFVPVNCCPSCTDVPDVAFADTDNPTTAESQTWVDANITDGTAGDLFYYPTAPDPLYVWVLCDDDSLLRIESPDLNIQAIIDIVDPDPDTFTTNAGNSFTTCPGGTITNYEWTLTHGGTQVANISGAPASDASGEATVASGTYTTPTWEPSVFDGTCGDLVVDLTATDSCGQTDAVSVTIIDYSVIALHFLNDGTGGADGVFNVTLSVSGGQVDWDMGDGTTYTGVNNPAHVYATPGVYDARAFICPKDLISIASLAEDGLLGTFEDIFSETAVSRFTNMQSFRIFDDPGFGGVVPSLTSLVSLTQLSINDTSVTGGVPFFAPSIEVINMDTNLLDGTIPPVSGYPALTDFNVSDNDLVGELPDLSNNPLLSLFRANRNLLTGTLPDLSANTLLTDFQVEDNLLTGDIHSTLTANTALVTYNVSRNQLTGAVLPDVTGLTALDLYHIDLNLIPAVTAVGYFSTNTVIRNIDMSNNLLTGAIPDTTPSGASLVVYRINSNSYTSAVPNFTANTALTTIDMGVNTLLTYSAGTFTVANAVLVSVNFNTNGMSATEVDNLIIDTESANTSNGTLNWSGQANSTAASTAAQTALTGRGWLLIGT